MMSIQLPEVGEYCVLTDCEGERIGRVVALNDDQYHIKYYYDGFTGYTVVTRKRFEVRYIPKPKGVMIPIDDE